MESLYLQNQRRQYITVRLGLRTNSTGLRLRVNSLISWCLTFSFIKWQHWQCLSHRAFVKVEQDTPVTVFGPVTGTGRLQWTLRCAVQMPLKEQRTPSWCWNATKTPQQPVLRGLRWLKAAPHPRSHLFSEMVHSQLTTDQHSGKEAQPKRDNSESSSKLQRSQ